MKCWITFAGVMLVSMGYGQVKRQFNVENTPSCEKINLTVRANSGNCYIKPSQNSDILNVFSNQDAESFSHNFVKEVKGKTCEVKLSLEETQVDGFGQTLSTRVFGSPEKAMSERYWKMYLTDSKPYALELNYGVGTANIDLSGLSVKKLKVSTGSADVNVGYYFMENRVNMDTFFVKVDLGSVNVRNVNLSRTQCLIADVGFGNMTLDFSNEPIISNQIHGSVGAGNLTIVLPSAHVPVLVKIHDSWLCSVSLSKNFKKVGENTFANSSYSADAKNSLVFNLDVSMGHIIFKDRLE